MLVHEVAARAKRGFTASLVRQMVVQSTGIGTSIVLARYLAPKDFGVFGLVSMIVQFFSFFATTGLATAVIRSKEEPTSVDQNSVFTCELIVASAAGLLLLAASLFLPRISSKFSPDNMALVWALGFSAWLTVFRLLPSVSLERQLEFSKIALVETVENLAFNAIAIFMALRHTGAWALVAATMTRSIAGGAFLNFLAPVRPRLTLASPRLRSMLAIGLGFQAPNLIFFLKDLVMPGFIAATLGSTNLGYFIWVRDFVAKFSTFSALFAKIAFPTMAKLSAVGEDLARSVRQSTLLLGIVYWPLSFALAATSSSYIHYVFSDKWFPAQPLLVIFIAASSFQILSPWYALSQAKSHWHWPLKVAFCVASWDICAGIILIKLFGLLGCGIAVVGSNIVYLSLYYAQMRRILPDTWRDALVPWKAKLLLNSVFAATCFFLVSRTIGNLRVCLAFTVLTCIVLAFTNWFLFSSDRAMLAKILSHFRPKTGTA